MCRLHREVQGRVAFPSHLQLYCRMRDGQRTHTIAGIETRLGAALRWVKEQGYKSSGSSCGGTMAVARVNCQLSQYNMGHQTGGADLLCREH